MAQWLKKNWFLIGLLAVAALPLVDSSEVTVNAGRWLKAHHGPDIIIVLIFFLSGLALNTSQIRAGVADYRGTLLALLVIFLVSPIVAIGFSFLPLQTGVLIGLLLVAAMPSTLSSGVVMSGAAGGNMAHALLITIIANSLAVITIPVTLELLLLFAGQDKEVVIDQLPIMLKIAKLVLLPLLLGILLRNNWSKTVQPILPYTSILNQTGILTVVWMASCQGRQAIVGSLGSVPLVIGLTLAFHLVLVVVALFATGWTGIGKGRRESVVLMGGQKTLPLSIILQVSLFPEYGLALVVCVLHHITHLAMDGFLIQYLREKE